ncbi:AAA family ATPase [Candidatus Woesearchaeota archaeon]|nr:AAA family ATPase [Candidatus Woesearchaeota archaeon]
MKGFKLKNNNLKKGKLKTGISGFDRLVNGGFNLGSSILLSGTPGTGKTIFALEFLYRGAQLDEQGLFVSLEDDAENLRKQAAQFGWDLQKMEDKGLIRILCIPVSEISNQMVRDLAEMVRKNGIRRLAVDSLSTLAINTPSVQSSISAMGDFAVRKFIYSFISEIRKLRYTVSLLIAQSPDERSLSCDSISEFACDGILHFTFESMGGQFSRSMIVRKMRRENNDEDVHPLEISKKGIVIHNIE